MWQEGDSQVAAVWVENQLSLGLCYNRGHNLTPECGDVAVEPTCPELHSRNSGDICLCAGTFAARSTGAHSSLQEACSTEKWILLWLRINFGGLID